MNLTTMLYYECFSYVDLGNGSLIISGGIDVDDECVVGDTRWVYP